MAGSVVAGGKLFSLTDWELKFVSKILFINQGHPKSMFMQNIFLFSPIMQGF